MIRRESKVPNSNKCEAIIVFNDLVHSPIKALAYEIKRQNELLAKGKTNANGETTSVKAKLGQNIDIYVKKLENNDMKLVRSVTLTEADAIITLTSPKVLLDLGLVLHEGEKSNYKRKTYKVKSGDTLAKIAHIKGSTIKELAKLNKIKNVNNISVGQVIKLPLLAPPAGSPNRTPNDDKSTLDHVKEDAKVIADKVKSEGKKLLERIKSLDIGRGETGSPKAEVKGLCKDQSSCIKKGDPASELIRELNIRLAGFGGALPTNEFTDLTEKCVKQFQRDYMETAETGRVCGGMLAALDDFMNTYPIDAFLGQMKCPCIQFGGGARCNGWGAGRINEYPGMHRSILWALRAVDFYLKIKEKDLKFSILKISSGYRCVENNQGHNGEHAVRRTINHMGMALDLHFNQNATRTRSTSDMNRIRQEIFIKYMGAIEGTRTNNHIFLESAAQAATTWVHFDMTRYDDQYKKSEMFVTSTLDANGSSILLYAKNNGNINLVSCAGNGALLSPQKTEIGQRIPVGQWRLSAKGEAFIKDYEKLRLDYYDDSESYCTVGWGHLVQGQVSCASLGISAPYKKYITETEAQKLFVKDKEKHENLVKNAIKVPLFQHEYDALCCLAFNVGSIAIKAPSLCEKVNSGNYAGGANEFLDITNHGNKGLVKRRKQENAMFLRADYTSAH